ncbi:MAG: hypothetical protein PHF72_04935 [Gammaproteobacteria bacterium]|nr:hypothetical protein [Gammaproteobacteria bacterium]
MRIQHILILLVLLTPALAATAPAPDTAPPGTAAAGAEFPQLLDKWLQGGGIAELELAGLRPGMDMAAADARLRDMGFVYSNNLSAYRSAGRQDRSRIRLQAMGAEAGFIEATEDFAAPLDLERARQVLIERFGPPDEEEGDREQGFLLAWSAGETRLTAAAGNSAPGVEIRGVVRFRLWTTRLESHRDAWKARCLELRALPSGERTPEQVEELLRCPMSFFE